MQVPEMEAIDTSLAMFLNVDHGDYHHYVFGGALPRGSRSCPSCSSLYYKDSESCVRVIPGPCPASIPSTTSVEAIYSHSASCIICRLLRNLIVGETGHREAIKLKTYPAGLCIATMVEDVGKDLCIIPERRLHNFGVVPGTKTSRTDFLDPYMIREWIEICKSTHKSGKNPVPTRPRLKTPIDITLIDVVHHRLIYGSSSMSFCALSYVWGGVEGFKTTSTNRAKLGLRRSLQQPQIWSQIPKAIKDAMRLVSLIGERYLWVDALCIQQDNAAMKHGQIMHMDIIYGHAMLTIVNLPGKNADAPLPRVPREADVLVEIISTSRLARQKAGQVNGAGLVAAREGVKETIKQSSHNTRAWTFQERLISQRCLFLGDYQCFFFCHSHLQAELPCQNGRNDALDISLDRNRSPPDWFVCLSQHSSRIEKEDESSVHFGHFQELLKAYRSKSLSHESDTLNAFSGILAALTEQSGWSFLSGLPEQHLEFGLLWIPDGLTPIRRVKGFPTWSWAAWNCMPSWDQKLGLSLPFLLLQEGRTAIADLKTFRQTPRRLICREPSMSTRISCPSDACAGLDVLVFHAYTVPYLCFGVAPGDSKGAQLIFDLEGRSCGVRCRSSRATEDASEVINKQMEIVLLSTFRRKLARDNNYSDHFSQQEYPYSNWAFLNVMFIRWERGYAERVCVGVMHERAFMKAGPIWKEILLA